MMRNESPSRQDHSKFYQPGIGEIPQATLTRAKREKLARRDIQIAEKEAELKELERELALKKQMRENQRQEIMDKMK